MSTTIVTQSAARRKKKDAPEFGFCAGDIGRYERRASTALKVETLLNSASLHVKEAIEIAAKESGNQTYKFGDSPLIDEDYLKDLHSGLIDVLLKVRDICQTRVRSLRLMEDMQEGRR